MPFIRNKKGNPVTTAENNTRGTNVQPTVHCRKCGKANHWQSVCRSSKWKKFIQGRKPAFKKSIHTIEDRGDEDNDEILTISTIEVNTIEDMQHSTTHDTRNEVFATLEITQPEKKRKINLHCKVDTGA